jgi:hypothetical protein
MTVYTLRKRRGQWTVFCGDNLLLDFRDYHEAIETTRIALSTLHPAIRAPAETEAPAPITCEGHA